MAGALLSLFGSWWARFFGPPSRRAEIVAPPREIESLEAAIAAVDEASRPPWVPMPTAVDHTQSLIETLQIDALPGTSTAPSAAVPTAVDHAALRERTLAALGNLRQIPALQSLAQSFLRALNQDDVSFGELVATIEKDSGLCVRVLRQANSVTIGSEQRVEDLSTAVHLLGVERVRQTAQALFTLRDAKRVAEGFDWRHLWMHALATASIAADLSRHLRGAEAAQLYLAALLHDVGKIVLSTIAPEDYREVLIRAWHEHGALEDLERERLGVDHREAGLLFARGAGLPEIVLQTIAHHDRPEEAEAFRADVALVAIANHVSKAHGLGFSGARLEANGADFEHLSAWRIVSEETGRPPDFDALAEELAAILPAVRADLRELRECA